MKIYEIGTGYTSIPARISAATEIVVEQLTKSLLEMHADVEIIDICDTNREKNNLPIIEVNIPLFLCDTDVQLGLMHKIKRVIYSIKLSIKLRTVLKENQSQEQDDNIVLHFHNQYNLFFFLKLISKKTRKECIIAYTNHSGIWSLEWNKVSSIIKKRYFQEAECMRRADLIYVLNDATKWNVINNLGVEEKRVIRLAHGVNQNIYYPLSSEEKEKIKSKYNLKDKKIILQVGSVYENKGQLRIIKNLTNFLKTHIEYAYVYVGGIVSEEYQGEINQYIKERDLNNQVVYLGMVNPGEELNSIYNIAEASIMASHYEAFGLVVIESMSAGVPVLINKNSQMFINKGVIKYEESTLSNIIEKEIDNKSKLDQYKKQAREYAIEHYGWNNVAQKYYKSWELYIKETK